MVKMLPFTLPLRYHYVPSEVHRTKIVPAHFLQISRKKKSVPKNFIWHTLLVSVFVTALISAPKKPLCSCQRAPAIGFVAAVANGIRSPVNKGGVIVVIRTYQIRVVSRSPTEQVAMVVGLIGSEIIILMLGKPPCTHILQVALREMYFLPGAYREFTGQYTIDDR